jgi:hypothetical protein
MPSNETAVITTIETTIKAANSTAIDATFKATIFTTFESADNHAHCITFYANCSTNDKSFNCSVKPTF